MTGRANTEADFWTLVLKSAPNECWPFLRSKGPKDCGTFTYHGKKWKAPRLALYFTCGSIQHCACHHCDNPPCCNPSHLYDGTHQQNMADVRIRRRHAGSRDGERNPSAKLTLKQVTAIRQLLRDGVPQRRIAEMFGVGQSQISNINRNNKWKV